MDKKRKIQFILIIAIMLILAGFLIYTLVKSIYDYTERTKGSNTQLELFNETYEKEGTKVVLIASTGCTWCKKFVPILDEISEEYNIKYTYVNAGLMFEEDFGKMYERLGVEFDGIPHLVIMKDQKVIGEQVGLNSKETTIELFKTAGLIEGDVEDGESISTNS